MRKKKEKYDGNSCLQKSEINVLCKGSTVSSSTSQTETINTLVQIGEEFTSWQLDPFTGHENLGPVLFVHVRVT